MDYFVSIIFQTEMKLHIITTGSIMKLYIVYSFKRRANGTVKLSTKTKHRISAKRCDVWIHIIRIYSRELCCVNVFLSDFGNRTSYNSELVEFCIFKKKYRHGFRLLGTKTVARIKIFFSRPVYV